METPTIASAPSGFFWDEIRVSSKESEAIVSLIFEMKRLASLADQHALPKITSEIKAARETARLLPSEAAYGALEQLLHLRQADVMKEIQKHADLRDAARHAAWAFFHTNIQRRVVTHLERVARRFEAEAAAEEEREIAWASLTTVISDWAKYYGAGGSVQIPRLSLVPFLKERSLFVGETAKRLAAERAADFSHVPNVPDLSQYVLEIGINLAIPA